LEAQVAARYDYYTARVGTSYVQYSPDEPTALPQYSGPTQDGKPFSSKARYDSHNETFGLKYNPRPEIALRVSRSTAFLPPTYSQLVPNPLPDSFKTSINDPKFGTYSVTTISGGNADLKPQNSTSWNSGLIWQPTHALEGVRVGVERYDITQENAIVSLTPQQIIDSEASFQKRVTRDSSGRVVLVDRTLVNLNKYKTSGYDFSVGYNRSFAFGQIDIQGSLTLIKHEQRQILANSPLLDYAGWPNSGGEAKEKANWQVAWSNSRWNLSWGVRYFGGYNQYHAPGDPDLPNGDIGPNSTVGAQGGLTVGSQVYHDLTVGYAFASGIRKDRSVAFRNTLLAGLKVQIGVRNVFDTFPPFDAARNTSPFFYSAYGDVRLRDIWISVKKTF